MCCKDLSDMDINKIKIEYRNIRQMELGKTDADIINAVYDLEYIEDLCDHLFTKYYPTANIWLRDKVVIDDENTIKLRNDRNIIVAHDTYYNAYVGCIILKKTDIEKKICSVYVNDHYKHLGIGSHLFELGFDYLGTKSPLFTVNSDLYPQFRHILNKYQFRYSKMYKNYYNINATEYSFNGYLNEN